MSPMGRREDSRKKVNQSVVIGAGLGLLPFRFAAPAVAAVGIKVLRDVQDAYGVQNSPVEQAAAAAVLGAGEFALGQATRAVRLLPWMGSLASAVITGAALKALGEGAIAYYQYASRSGDAESRSATATETETATRVDFS